MQWKKKRISSYIVNCSKIFITSAGEADIYMVLVRTDPEKGPQGMSLLIIEGDTAGLSFGRPEDLMGMRSASSREVFFSDCPGYDHRYDPRNLICRSAPAQTERR
ncbi:MAG: acyl-CoA dehydrogenase family protein [Desulfomonilaceae bacterium]